MPVSGLKDLLMRLFEEFLVLAALPSDEARDDAMEAFTLGPLSFFGWETIGVCGGIIDQLREQHSTGCR
jgi:hypothetical protein